MDLNPWVDPTDVDQSEQHCSGTLEATGTVQVLEPEDKESADQAG